MSEDQASGTERLYNAKGFDLKNELASYVPPCHEKQEPAQRTAVPVTVAEQPVTPPLNPDDDVSVVIFGGLEERTRMLLKRRS